MTRPDLSRVRLALVLSGALAACGPADVVQTTAGPVHAPTQTPAKAPGADATATARITRADASLQAIGYVDFSAPDDGPDGVVVHDAARSCPGDNLYVSIPFGTAFLIDADGAIVHRWTTDEDVQWTRAALLPDGRLLVICARGTEEHFECRGWNGELLWRRQISAHHDFHVLPDGEILVLTQRPGLHPELDPEHPLLDNGVARLRPDGTELDELSVYAAWRDSPLADALAPVSAFEPNYLGLIDWFHCNSVDVIDGSERTGTSALYSASNLLLSARHQSLIFVVDGERGQVVWAWGRGELERQHEATLLSSGRILVFDNGSKRRGYSRIVEVDPLTDRITWQWKAPDPSSFFCHGRGTAQGLPNGNVLVGHSDGGEAFELTREGEIVWRFLNPQRSEDGARGSLRIHRYPPAYVQGVLDRVAVR